ncbi:OmpH family outer membrane protein [bacterium]
MRKFNCALISIFLLSFGMLNAVSLSTEKVGFVDIEKIFESSDISKNAQDEVKQKLNDLNKSLKEKKGDLKDLKSRYELTISSISIIEIQIKNFKPQKKEAVENNTSFAEIDVSTMSVTQDDAYGTISTHTVIAKEIDIKDLKNQLEEFENDLPIIRKKIKKTKVSINFYEEERLSELEDLKKSYSYNILGIIYDVIVEVAIENSYSLVIDKNHMLYGESLNDLTDKVLERLKTKNKGN